MCRIICLPWKIKVVVLVANRFSLAYQHQYIGDDFLWLVATLRKLWGYIWIRKKCQDVLPVSARGGWCGEHALLLLFIPYQKPQEDSLPVDHVLLFSFSNQVDKNDSIIKTVNFCNIPICESMHVFCSQTLG